MNNANLPANATPYMDLTETGGELYCDNTGLTKREMFAMHAMQGILANLGCTHEKSRVAIYAVDFADNLLRELENDGLQR